MNGHKFFWDVIGFTCQCGQWHQRFGRAAEAERNHAEHVVALAAAVAADPADTTR